MASTKTQTELIQRRPILSARQVAVAVIFGAITLACELLQITIPGYLPGVNFSLTGIWLTTATMIGGPIVGLIVCLADSLGGQVGIIGWPGFIIHTLIFAAFYPWVYRQNSTIKRIAALLLACAVALFFQYWWWIGLYTYILKLIPLEAQLALQFGYAYWVYLVIYFLIPAILLASVPKFVAPAWRWPWQQEKDTDAEVGDSAS